MKNVHGHCVCGAVEITIREYGNFVYACHCDTCRRMNSGPVMSVDPGPGENVVFSRGEDQITIYHDEEIERGFCSRCGSILYWHDRENNHFCMNAELFDDVIQNASFELELFYDHKPAYYNYTGERKRLDHNYEEYKPGSQT